LIDQDAECEVARTITTYISEKQFQWRGLMLSRLESFPSSSRSRIRRAPACIASEAVLTNILTLEASESRVLADDLSKLLTVSIDKVLTF